MSLSQRRGQGGAGRLQAAKALFIPSRPRTLARRINQGLGIGFLAGMTLGPLTLFVFIARIVS